MKISLLSFSLLLSLYTKAQELDLSHIGAAGKEVQVGNINLTYTIGETNYASSINSTLVLTMGFIQPTTTLSTSVINFPAEYSIEVFPNPTTTSLTVRTSVLDKQLEIAIYEMSGKRVFSESITDEVTHINLNHLASGTYTLQIKHEDLFNSYQIIKH